MVVLASFVADASPLGLSVLGFLARRGEELVALLSLLLLAAAGSLVGVVVAA